MKISEIEKRIQMGHFSEELFSEFQTALKRVPKNMRCQHCYTAAYYLKDKDPKNAIRMIQYGIDAFESDWIDKMRACQNLGGIYEANGQFTEAKAAYEAALAAIPEDKRDAYTPSLSMDILRAELHCTKFEYSEYADKLYQHALNADGFSSTSRHFIFYRAIMELIIARKNNDVSSQKAEYAAAVQALDGDTVTGMDLILKRHKYKDDANASKESIRFLKSNKP